MENSPPNNNRKPPVVGLAASRWASAAPVALGCLALGVVLLGRWLPGHKYQLAWSESQPLCGPYAVMAVAELHGVSTDIGEVSMLAHLAKDGATLLGCKQALQELGIPSDSVAFKTVRAIPAGLPAICVVESNAGLHAVAIVRNSTSVLVIDGGVAREISCRNFDQYCVPVALIAQAPYG